MSTRYTIFHVITFLSSVNDCQKLFSCLWFTLTIRHRNFILEVSKLLNSRNNSRLPAPKYLRWLGDKAKHREKRLKNVSIFCKQQNDSWQKKTWTQNDDNYMLFKFLFYILYLAWKVTVIINNKIKLKLQLLRNLQYSFLRNYRDKRTVS